MTLSFQTLPIEIIYRVLDELNDKQLFLSIINVSRRLNMIINSYKRYQVNLNIYYTNYFISHTLSSIHYLPYYIRRPAPSKNSISILSEFIPLIHQTANRFDQNTPCINQFYRISTNF